LSRICRTCFSIADGATIITTGSIARPPLSTRYAEPAISRGGSLATIRVSRDSIANIVDHSGNTLNLPAAKAGGRFRQPVRAGYWCNIAQEEICLCSLSYGLN
ncbi:MAG: hypothetical protein M1596_02930, partial [Firmicutes bacterium]|nr:hypothetical protein [Bacillota bacterium]